MLLGDTKTTAETQPKIIPELQNKSVISVAIGDYHHAALTAEGRLFTWGAYSSGALGLGDPARLEPGAPGGFAHQQSYQIAMSRRRGTPSGVERPTEVRFDHEGSVKKSFCFAVTAAGWHTGALVIDLEVCLFCYNFHSLLIHWQPGNNEKEPETSQDEDSDSSEREVQFETVNSDNTQSIFRRGYATLFGQVMTGGSSST